MTTGIPPTLPLRTLLDMNAKDSWVRPVLENSKLKDSIARNGMKLPILVAPDFSVVDGFQRLYVAADLRFKDVPVIIARDWETFIKYQASVKALEAEGWPSEPMNWLQLSDLWLNVLPKLYQEYRYRQATETRNLNKAMGTKYHQPTIAHYNEALAQLYGFASGNQVKVVRDLYSTYRRCVALGFGNDAELLIQMLQQAGGRGLRTVQSDLQHIAAGRMTPAQAIEHYRNTFKGNRVKNNVPKTAAGRPILGKAPEPTPEELATQAAVVERLVTMVDTIGAEASYMTAFAKLDLLTAGELADRLRRAVNKLNALRRRLEEHATPQPTHQRSTTTQ